MGSPLSLLMVTHDSREDLQASLPAMLGELRDGDQLVVVDNASADGTAELVEQLAPQADVVRNPRNDGFAAAMNLAAGRASGELLVLINPDATPQPGWAEAIRAPLESQPRWTAWQALVTQDDGREINTAGNDVHFTGVSWAGATGRPIAAAAPAGQAEVGFASGACLAIRRADWQRLGGFSPEYFMYCEDLDLGLRARLAGGRIGVAPDARVEHAYEFMANPAKWRHLERNRWATILRTYPGPLLALVAPALLATELAIFALALAGGWWRHKLLAWGDTLRALPRLRAERHAIQATRAVSVSEFAEAFTPSLTSPYLGRAGEIRALDLALRAYWRGVRALLRARGRR